MLDANLSAQLKAYLEKVTQPIEIVESLDGGAKSAELHELLEEITALSAQAWMTGTDLSLFDRARAQIFEVREGRFARQEDA